MKRAILFIVNLIVSVEMTAQTVTLQLYKNGTLVKEYDASEVDEIRFGERVSPAFTGNLLPGKFTVGDDKQVQFAKSNLYWDGNTYRFEANQTDFPKAWDANHVGHFYWTNLTDYQSGNSAYMPYVETYYDHGYVTTNDKFWCGEENKLTVEGTDSLYALTNCLPAKNKDGEWYYLIKRRPNAANLYKYDVMVDSLNCFIIAPDDFTGTLKSNYTLDEVNSLGLVCLPPAGYRVETEIGDIGPHGYYWSSTSGAYSSDALDLYFTSYGVFETNADYRRNGCALRLVKTVSDSNK